MLEQKLIVADTNGLAIRKALSCEFADMEDAFQQAVTLENHCQIIITRNLRDYAKSNLPVMTAEQYLRSSY